MPYADNGGAPTGVTADLHQDQMHGFREIRLTSNIDEIVSNHLNQPMDQCPFEDIMVRSINMFHFKAESSSKRNDFTSTYFYWHHLQRYWVYHQRLEQTTNRIPNNSPFTQLPDSRLKKALHITTYKFAVSALAFLKIMLRLQNYFLAIRIARSPNDWLQQNEISASHLKHYTCIGPSMRAKFAFYCALARVARGQSEEGRFYIEYGMTCLCRYGHFYAQRTSEDEFDELRNSIDHELIQRESRWRCGRKDKDGVKARAAKTGSYILDVSHAGTGWKYQARNQISYYPLRTD